MKILILSEELPSTTRMPGSPRLFNLSRELTRAHQLILLCRPKDMAQAEAFAEDPESLGVYSSIIRLDPPRAPVSWRQRQLHRFTLTPSFITKYRYPEHWSTTVKKVQETLEKENVDLIYCNGVAMAQYIPWRTDVPTVVDFTDSLTHLLSQQANFEPSAIRRFKMRLETRAVSLWEAKVSSLADLVVAISPTDEQSIKALTPNAETIVVSNGIDAEYFRLRDEERLRQSSRQLIFTGVMGYGPNEDAADYFARDILPRIQEAHPDAEFQIVGADVTEKVQALSSLKGVTVTGAVPDIRTYLNEAEIFVCPLRYGAGVKNKLLSAMAVGLPIVATRLSISGTLAEPDTHLLIADNPEEFVEKIDMLFQSPDLRRKLTRNSRRLVEERYCWSARVAELEEGLKARFPRLYQEGENNSPNERTVF